MDVRRDGQRGALVAVSRHCVVEEDLDVSVVAEGILDGLKPTHWVLCRVDGKWTPAESRHLEYHKPSIVVCENSWNAYWVLCCQSLTPFVL